MTAPLNLYLLGTGLIGGSLSLALSSRGLARVTGWDADDDARRRALSLGILEEEVPPSGEAFASADLVVLAVPVLALASLLRRGFPPGTLVTDTGSVKADAVRAYRDALSAGASYRFIPGHPIAGDERSGPDAARPDLFSGARVVLTPLPENEPADTARVRALWEGAGASVLEMEPGLHDRVYAWVSHLPHMAAFALVEAVGAKDPSWFSHSGGGLRDYTRVAGSSPRMWADIAIANRMALAEAVEGLVAVLERIGERVRAGDRDALEELFARAAARRRGMP